MLNITRYHNAYPIYTMKKLGALNQLKPTYHTKGNIRPANSERVLIYIKRVLIMVLRYARLVAAFLPFYTSSPNFHLIFESLIPVIARQTSIIQLISSDDA